MPRFGMFFEALLLLYDPDARYGREDNALGLASGSTLVLCSCLHRIYIPFWLFLLFVRARIGC